MSAKNLISQLISIIIESTNSSKKPVSENKQEDEKPGLKSVDGFYEWKKGYNFPLSKYFSTKEFSCKCNFPDCKTQRISKTLITQLDQVREEIKQPLIITSAYRCMKHQAFLRAAGVNTVVAKQSTHEQGLAADIVPKDMKDTRGAFLKIVEKHFDSIGLSSQFLHVDLRVGKRRWEY